MVSHLFTSPIFATESINSLFSFPNAISMLKSFHQQTVTCDIAIFVLSIHYLYLILVLPLSIRPPLLRKPRYAIRIYIVWQLAARPPCNNGRGADRRSFAVPLLFYTLY